MLTKTEINTYKEVGAIVIEGVLDDVTRQHMNKVLADLVERSRATKTHDAVYDLEPGHSSEEPRVRRIKTPNGALYIVPGTHKGPTYDHHDADGRFSGAMDFEGAGLRFANATPCVGPAGSCSFHHVRVVHGSAQNRSNRPRGLMLYEASAADAFPLLGIPDYDDFKSRLLCGQETIVPRLVDCPVRMPLPPALNQGSIYENQSGSSKRFFDLGKVAGTWIARATCTKSETKNSARGFRQCAIRSRFVR